MPIRNPDGTYRPTRKETLILSGTLISATGLAWLLTSNGNRKLVEKIWASIQTGNASQDIGEIIQSRLTPDRSLPELLEQDSHYHESWFEKTCNNWSIHSLQGTSTKAGFFDVTATCQPLAVELLKGTQVPDGLGNRYDTEFYSLSATLPKEPYLTLPLPLFGSQQVDFNIYQRYNRYAFFAGHKQNGHFDTTASETPVMSKKRGGLAIIDGKTLALPPNEFSLVDSTDPSVSAMIEYGFVFESNTLQEDFNALAEAEMYGGLIPLKNLAFTMEYSSAVVSYYKQDGTPHTIAMALFSPFDEHSGKFGGPAQAMNIPQLISLIEQFRQQKDYVRFVIALPDPSIASQMYTPLNFTEDTVRRLGGKTRFSPQGASMVLEGDVARYFRVLGDDSDCFVYPDTSFPFVIASTLS